MNRALWVEQFKKWPNWPCPSCDTGILKVQKETFKTLQTAESKKAIEHDAWDPEWIEQRFVAALMCSNDECGEIVYACGDSGIEENMISFDEREHIDLIRPKFFNPPLPILRILRDCPSELQDELRKSFSLFWSDLEAAANRMRAAVEVLLSDVGIAKNTLDKNRKRVRLTLHSRIDKVRGKNPKLAHLLEAVKWLGNSGSHYGGNALTRSNVLDGFELIEHAIELVYDRREDRLTKVASAINKNKGPFRVKR